MLFDFGTPHNSFISSICIAGQNQYLFTCDSEGKLMQWYTEDHNNHVNNRKKKLIRSNKKKHQKKNSNRKRTLYEIIQNTNLSDNSGNSIIEDDGDNSSDIENDFFDQLKKMVKNYGRVHKGAIAALSSYNNFVFSIDENSVLCKWNVYSCKLINTFENLNIHRCSLLTSCFDFLVICSDHGTLSFWSIKDEAPDDKLWKVQFKGVQINSIDQTSTKEIKSIITSDTRGNIYTYDVDKRSIINAFVLDKISITNFKFILNVLKNK